MRLILTPLPARPTLMRLGLALAVLAILFGVPRLWPKPPLSSYAPSSTAVFDRNGRLLRLTLAPDEQYRLWVPLEQVSPQLVEALLLQEDRAYYWHYGVNPVAIVRAAAMTSLGIGIKQGGSTISMQLARLIYRLNTRSIGGKLRQIAYATRLELQYSKHDILEAHLNLMPYGQNIQGVAAASLIHFNKPPSQLNLPEALSLVVIPQAPGKRTVAGAETRDLTTARIRLLRQWRAAHPQQAGAADIDGLMRLPLNLRTLRDLPFEAPHLVNMHILEAARSGETMVRSSVDLGLQRVLERQVRQYVARESRVGIRNAAAMLVDTRDMQVRAVVGSADFFDAGIDGQVNGTLAKRSPGSTLKPFVYGLAIDQGLIHPASVIKDAPTAFGPFSPENFDGQFVGPISARDALIKSRNVPAVALAAQLSGPSLYEFLKSAGVAKLAPEKHYGLSLALGGGEASVEELATLYAMLANRGELKPLRYRAGKAAPAAGTRLLSEEAAFMVLDMLKDNPRPDTLLVGAQTGLPVYWKTGTSWGFRDAWTAGIFGPYVLVVWTGNFNGEGNPALVGVRAAAPLFFQIVDAVKNQQRGLSEPVFRQPGNLERIEVCTASGDLPNAACPLKTKTWFIPGKSPIRVSDVHRLIAVDTRSGRQACPGVPEKFVRTTLYEVWPSDLARLFAQAGMPRKAPPVADDCGGGQTLVAGRAGNRSTTGSASAMGTLGNEGRPQITSPIRGAAYALRASRAGDARVALNATADGEVRQLYWFIGDAYIGSSKPGVALAWRPERPGSYTVRAVDEQGRGDSRELKVAAVE